MRDYWDGRDLAGRRRIAMFGRNLYRHGLLGRTIQLGHVVCRLHGKRPQRMLDARDLAEQRRLFEAELAPVFDSRLVRQLADLPAAYFGLGIPPAQFDALKADAGGNLASLLRAASSGSPATSRSRRTGSPGRPSAGAIPARAHGLPPYLRPENFAGCARGSDRVEIEQITFTDFLRRQDARTVDAYVLLDAQDWMSRAQIAALWADRTAPPAPGARVIFRTAGEETPLPQMLPAGLLAPWHYEEDRSRELHARDRSAIYGGFHLYRHAG